MLDLKIITFLKVVETESYTAAAEALHMTQPAVTQHIHKLEEHYGCRLIVFAGRSFRLTAGGRALYEYAVLQTANEEMLIDHIEGRKDRLRIGATLSAADYYLQPALNACLLDRGHDMSVSVANTETLLSQVFRGELDCAFVEGNFDRELFGCREFCRAEFLPVAAASHPLAGSEAPLEALYRYPLVLREQGSGTRDICENYLRQRNDSLHSFVKIIEMSSFVMIKSLVRTSHAVTFMYEGVAREDVKRGELCYLDLEDYHITHPIHFVYLKNGMNRGTAEEVFRRVRAGERAERGGKE